MRTRGLEKMRRYCIRMLALVTETVRAQRLLVVTMRMVMRDRVFWIVEGVVVELVVEVVVEEG